MITDDGAFAHDILSPKHHIDKTYVAVLDKPVDSRLIDEFKKGVSLGETELLSAELKPLSEDGLTAEVVIRQGVFHQIKRMFSKYGITVLALKRTKMGDLELDNSLSEGECRYLNADEVLKIG